MAQEVITYVKKSCDICGADIPVDKDYRKQVGSIFLDNSIETKYHLELNLFSYNGGEMKDICVDCVKKALEKIKDRLM